MAQEHFDVLIMGAGLSGIDAAYHLQKRCPNKSYVILEQRERIGGTWDLFRYPGIRSDSDMLTMGYSFRPWTLPKAISPGSDIREYIAATARDEGIDRNIRFRHQIKRASWSSPEAKWTVETVRTLPDGRDEIATLTCNFLFSCAGYYRYSAGYLPEFPNASRFKGQIVHPQIWPEDLDYAGKRVVIIGSGATTVTLVPAMARTAGHVTMLQRSPTYIISAPEQDKIANWLRRVLPAMWAYRLSRWKNVGFMTYFYYMSQRFPNLVKKDLLKKVREHLGPDYDVETHFTPRYNPWEQRLCLVPDADMLQAIKSNRASVVTDHIETFTEKGILLKSGKELEADIIVTATGLVMQGFGGIELFVDEQPVDPGRALAYKGVMMSGVPNLASVFGYINASWTLKADLICNYVCRLLNFMDRKGMRQVTPKDHGERPAAPFVEHFTPGYIERGVASWPKQGSKSPWRVYQNYIRDTISLKWRSVDDGVLEFSNPPQASPSPAFAPTGRHAETGPASLSRIG
ncbi:MAG TPA: NAD(P)/FAD-dependent oxidoreductase [Candidatus Angelobacter sp.]|nr:NAD(P)/FAD-dependent oxidoreductase [Candidatus Angelobacter sp.]